MMEYGAENKIWDKLSLWKLFKWRPNLNFLKTIVHYVNYINVV